MARFSHAQAFIAPRRFLAEEREEGDKNSANLSPEEFSCFLGGGGRGGRGEGSYCHVISHRHHPTGTTLACRFFLVGNITMRSTTGRDEKELADKFFLLFHFNSEDLCRMW